MRRILTVFFIAALFFSCSTAIAVSERQVKIVVFGDSLTSGFQIGKGGSYAVRLQDKLEKIGFVDFSVVDMSVTGDSTSSAYSRVNSVIAARPDIVVVALGVDDAAKKIDPGAINQYIGLAIARLLEKGIGVVLLGVDAPPGQPDEYRQYIDSVYASLAKYYKTAFIPNILDGVIGNPEHNLADRYRPNGKGVDVMVENSYRTIGAYMKNVIEQKDAQGYVSGPDAPLPPSQPVPELK